MKLVERHIIKSNHKYFTSLLEMAHFSKNLYNQVNYFIRREFIENRKRLRYSDVDKLCKNLVEHNDYRTLPTAQVVQQTLRLLDKNWKAHPSKYLGKPKYLAKNGYNILLFMNKVMYKAQLRGIEVILHGESYTSGTSFLDREEPVKENYNINRRRKRGLFESNTGKLINADVNASLQIAKKVSCDVNFDQQVEGLVFNPVKVCVA